MLLMEMGFLPQLLSAAPAHDSASVITPPSTGPVTLHSAKTPENRP
jgi:hypothetical protein